MHVLFYGGVCATGMSSWRHASLGWLQSGLMLWMLRVLFPFPQVVLLIGLPFWLQAHPV
jgi:hypothetical protein